MVIKKDKIIFKDGIEQTRRQHKYFKVHWGFRQPNLYQGRNVVKVLFTAFSSHIETKKPSLPSGDDEGRRKVQPDV
jgi:hypothetical protein